MYATVYLTDADPTAPPVPDETADLDYMTHVRYVVRGLEPESVLYGDAPLSHFYTKEKQIVNKDLAMICHSHVAGMLKLPIARTIEGEDMLNTLRRNIRRARGVGGVGGGISLNGEENSTSQTTEPRYKVIPSAIMIARVKTGAKSAMRYCNEFLAQELHAKLHWGSQDGIIFHVDLRIVIEDMMDASNNVSVTTDIKRYEDEEDHATILLDPLNETSFDNQGASLNRPVTSSRHRSRGSLPQYDDIETYCDSSCDEDTRTSRRAKEHSNHVPLESQRNVDARQQNQLINNIEEEDIPPSRTKRQDDSYRNDHLDSRGGLRASEKVVINGFDPNEDGVSEGRRPSIVLIKSQNLEAGQSRRRSNDHDDISLLSVNTDIQSRRGSNEHDSVSQLNASNHSKLNTSNHSKLNTSNHSKLNTSNHSKLNASNHSSARRRQRPKETPVTSNGFDQDPNPSRRSRISSEMTVVKGRRGSNELNASNHSSSRRRQRPKEITVRRRCSNDRDRDSVSQLNTSQHSRTTSRRRQRPKEKSATNNFEQDVQRNPEVGGQSRRGSNDRRGNDQLDASNHSRARRMQRPKEVTITKSFEQDPLPQQSRVKGRNLDASMNNRRGSNDREGNAQLDASNHSSARRRQRTKDVSVINDGFEQDPRRSRRTNELHRSRRGPNNEDGGIGQFNTSHITNVQEEEERKKERLLPSSSCEQNSRHSRRSNQMALNNYRNIDPQQSRVAPNNHDSNVTVRQRNGLRLKDYDATDGMDKSHNDIFRQTQMKLNGISINNFDQNQQIHSSIRVSSGQKNITEMNSSNQSEVLQARRISNNQGDQSHHSDISEEAYYAEAGPYGSNNTDMAHQHIRSNEQGNVVNRVNRTNQRRYVDIPEDHTISNDQDDMHFDASLVEDVQESRRRFGNVDLPNHNHHFDDASRRQMIQVSSSSVHEDINRPITKQRYRVSGAPIGNEINDLDPSRTSSRHPDVKQDRRRLSSSRSGVRLDHSGHGDLINESQQSFNDDLRISRNPVRSEPNIFGDSGMSIHHDSSTRSDPNIFRGEDECPVVPGNSNRSMFSKSSSRSMFSKSSNGSGSNSNCLVCFEHKKIFAFVPCGHLCLCEKCARSPPYEFRDGIGTASSFVCPVCRMKGASIMRVYF